MDQKTFSLLYLNSILTTHDTEVQYLQKRYNVDTPFLFEKLASGKIKDCDIVKYLVKNSVIEINIERQTIIAKYCLDSVEKDCFQLILKVSKYNRNDSSNHPLDVEWLITNKLFELYKQNIFIFMLVPVASFYCMTRSSTVRDALSKFLKVLDFDNKLNLYEPGIKYRFTILEDTSYINLNKFITQLVNRNKFSYEVFEFIMFNIVFMLTTLNKYIPNFRHNNFIPNIILIKKHNKCTLEMDCKIIRTPYFFYLLINDFYYSNILRQTNNAAKIYTNNENINSDFINFINTISYLLDSFNQDFGDENNYKIIELLRYTKIIQNPSEIIKDSRFQKYFIKS